MEQKQGSQVSQSNRGPKEGQRFHRFGKRLLPPRALPSANVLPKFFPMASERAKILSMGKKSQRLGRTGPRKAGKKSYLFQVVVTHDPKERGPYKYMAEVPAMDGCFTDGRTREEALENIKEVIELLLTTARERKRSTTELVEISI